MKNKVTQYKPKEGKNEKKKNAGQIKIKANKFCKSTQLRLAYIHQSK